MSNRSIITIIKPPKEIDANRLVKEEIHKRNMICPFCGEMRKGDLVSNLISERKAHGVCYMGICRRWYGKYDGDENTFSCFRFWERNFHYQRDGYKCFTCGAEWYSQPYPTNLGNYR